MGTFHAYSTPCGALQKEYDCRQTGPFTIPSDIITQRKYVNKSLAGIIFSILILRAQLSAAEGTNTNQVTAIYVTALESKDPVPADFWDAYKHKWLHKDHLFIDRFGATAGLDLTEQMVSQRYGFFGQQAFNLRDASVRSAVDSLRDTAVQWLPLEEWEYAAGGTFRNWFGDLTADLIEGSFGNSVEQENDLLAISYSATDAAWKSKMRASSRVQFGIRPGSQYAYFSANIGSLHNRPILISDFRYYLTRNGSGVIRTQLTMPFSDSVYLSGAFSCDPTDMSAHGRNPPSASLVLEKVIGNYLIDNAFIGVSFGGLTSFRGGFFKKF